MNGAWRGPSGGIKYVTAGTTHTLINDQTNIGGSEDTAVERWAVILNNIHGTMRLTFTGVHSRTGYLRYYYLYIDGVWINTWHDNDGTSNAITWVYDFTISNITDCRVALWSKTSGGQVYIYDVKIQTNEVLNTDFVKG